MSPPALFHILRPLLPACPIIEICKYTLKTRCHIAYSKALVSSRNISLSGYKCPSAASQESLQPAAEQHQRSSVFT